MKAQMAFVIVHAVLECTACIAHQLARPWQAYNIELRECLISLSHTPDPQVESKMQQLALEALRLSGCRLLLNPAVHEALISGHPKHGHDAQHQLDQTFYISLLVSHSHLPS